MPFTYELTSPKTGRTYTVEADAELPEADIDALVNEQDFESARAAGVQPGVDPSVLSQGPLGTLTQSIPQTFAKVGSGMISGAGRLLDKASESLSQATGLPKGGDIFQRMADYGDELATSADITFPTNPENPTAGAIGSGAAQGMSLLAGGLAGKALTGSNAAMTAVPMVSGFLSGANQGIQSAERIGVQSPLAQLGMGAGFGSIEMLTERLGGIGSKTASRMLTESVRKTAGQMARTAGKSIGSEAFEEVLAGVSQDALTRLAASEDPNNPGFTTTGVSLADLSAQIVNLEARKLEAIGGAAGGTIFAGAQALANRTLPPAPPPGSRITDQASLEEDLGDLTAEDVADLNRQRVPGFTDAPFQQPVTPGGADVARDFNLRRQAPGFRDDPLSTAPPATGDVITDLRIPRSPEAIAESNRLENERLAAAARLRNIDAKAQGMPLIPDSPSGSRDILDFANENPIYLPPGFSEQRNLPEYEGLKEAKLPPYWRQFIASGKRGGNPSEVAQRAFDAGLIAEPTADAYFEALRGGISGRQQYRVQFKQREQALAAEEKRVVDFEKTQDKLARKRKEPATPVSFEDIVPGDQMTIDGEPAVVRNVEYNEDGYLTNVVIEDGKRFGLMQFDPQSRSGLLVDEFQPAPRRDVAADEFAPEDAGVGQTMSDPFATLLEGTESTRPRNRGETARPQTADPLAELGAATRAGAANQAQGRMDPLMSPANRLGRGLADMLPPRPATPSPLGERWWAATTREEARAVLEPASLEELKAIATRMDVNPNQSKSKLIDRLVQLTGVYADSVSIRGITTPRGPMPDYSGRSQEEQQRRQEQQAERQRQRALEPKERLAPKAKPRTPEEFARDMAAIMTTPRRQTVGTVGMQMDQQGQATTANLSAAYTTAARGSSSQMVPIRAVYEAARAQNPQLTVPQFLAEVQAADAAGQVLLEPFDSPASLTAAGEFTLRNSVGVPTVNMMVVPAEQQQPSTTANNRQPLSTPPLDSPATQAAIADNQARNEAALKALGLPTQKGTRIWGREKVAEALRRISRDANQPATLRFMARLLSRMPLGNLLLKIEADARLNYAGLYQPMAAGRGEISLNTRRMSRGEATGQGDVVESLVHEVLHHVTYNVLRNPKTAAQKQAKADLEALRKRALAALSAQEMGSQFDYELSNVDEFISALFTRADFQTALASIPLDAAPRALGQRVRTMLDEVFRILAELVTGQKVEAGSVLEASFASTLRLIEVQGDTMTGGQGDGVTGPAPLKSYAGERSIENLPEERRQFMRDSLETARTMAAAGKTSEEIRAVTGWFPGKYDGRMRWEIPDEGARLLPRLEILQKGEHPAGVIRTMNYRVENGRWYVSMVPQEAKRTSDIITLEDADASMVKGLVPAPIWRQMQDGKGVPDLDGPNLDVPVKRLEEPFLFDGMNVLPLDEVLKHPSLFQAYPEARNLYVRVDPELRAGGSFATNSDGDKIITLGRLGQLSTLLHEVQHWIQEKEGLARGSNPKQFESPVGLPRDIINLAVDIAQAAETYKMPVAQIRANPPRRFQSVPQEAWFLAENRSIKELLKEQEFSNRSANPEGAYRRTAGEIEARDVQARQSFTPEQRKAIEPYSSENIAKEDAIVIFGGTGAQASSQSSPIPDPSSQIPNPSSPLASPAAPIPNETQSRFASPDPAGRTINGPRTDEIVAAEATAWLNSVDPQTAVELFHERAVPLPLDAMEHAAALLLSRLSGQAVSGSSEVQRMWAHTQAQRMGRLWTREFLSADPARALRQRGVVDNTILAPIAPVLAAQEVLTDRAEAKIGPRFEGGTEGVTERIITIIKYVDRVTGETLTSDLRPQAGTAGTPARLRSKHPKLEAMLNKLRKKLYPGMSWADIFTELPGTQKDRQREIYRRLMLDERLSSLTQDERLALTNELDKAWQRERRKVFMRELDKAKVLGEKDKKDREKVKAATPRLLRLMNLGMLNSELFREALAQEYGVRQITPAIAAELRALGERIQTAPEGLPRRKLEQQLVEKLQSLVDATLWQTLDSYWTASVLSGWRTQVDIGLSLANGIEDVGLGSVVTAIRTGNKDVAVRALGALFGRIPSAFLEAVDHIATGNKAMMRNFELEAKQAMEGGNRLASDVGAAMWKRGGWRKVPGGFMVFYGRLLTALDHINSASTREGALAMALARHPELYQRALRITPADRAAARKQARQELTLGTAPANRQQRLEEDARVREILEQGTPPELLDEALEVGRRAALQGDPTGLGGWVMDGVLEAVSVVNMKAEELAGRENADAISKINARITAALVPFARSLTGTKFIRTVAHAANRNLSYVPGIGAVAVGQEGRTGAFADILIARQIIGTLVGIALYLAFDDDEDEKGIEDSWRTKTPQQKAQLYAQGKQPYSVWGRDAQGRVVSYNYQQWGIAGIMATVAAMHRNKGNPEGTVNALIKSLWEGGLAFGDKAQLQGLQTVFGEQYRSTDPAAGVASNLNKWAAQTVGGLVPRIAKDIDNQFSPELRDTSHWWQRWAKEVPMVRELSSGKRVDILGEDIKLDRGPLSRVRQVGTADPAYRTLGLLNSRDIYLPDPSTGVRIVRLADGTRRPMTPLEKDRYQRLTGAAYRELLTEKGPQLLQMDPEDAKDYIFKTTKRLRDRAAVQAVK